MTINVTKNLGTVTIKKHLVLFPNQTNVQDPFKCGVTTELGDHLIVCLPYDTTCVYSYQTKINKYYDK